MAGLGIGLFFGGYSLLYYGLSQVTGHNYGLLDLVVPSRWVVAEVKPPPIDKPTSGSSSTNVASAATKAAELVTPGGLGAFLGIGGL